jgi:hypothetical protein
MRYGNLRFAFRSMVGSSLTAHTQFGENVVRPFEGIMIFWAELAGAACLGALVAWLIIRTQSAYQTHDFLWP